MFLFNNRCVSNIFGLFGVLLQENNRNSMTTKRRDGMKPDFSFLNFVTIDFFYFWGSIRSYYNSSELILDRYGQINTTRKAF
jgi:hypothetical protein